MNDSAILVDITGLDAAELFAALFNRARPLGLGIIHYKPRTMLVDEARTLITNRQFERNGIKTAYADYFEGRVMKIDVLQNPMRFDLYERDNGLFSIREVIRQLREANERK